MRKRGRFITIEGGEGAGKSTAVAFISDALRSANVDTICTREPGGTRLGERLRDLLLEPSQAQIVPKAELLMMFAARAQHIEERITPALDSGKWVLCDRFTDASFAYQGAGRALGTDMVGSLEHHVQGDLRPDVTLLLDVPVDIGMARARGRGSLDRIELEGLDFFERVRGAYLARAAENCGRYHVIDASQDLHDVQAALAAFCEGILRDAQPMETE